MRSFGSQYKIVGWSSGFFSKQLESDTWPWEVSKTVRGERVLLPEEQGCLREKGSLEKGSREPWGNKGLLWR